MDGEEIYEIFAKITATVVFIISWIYCIIAYGFLLGVALGWIPSLIVASILGALWPLVWIAVAFVIYTLLRY